MVVIVPVVIRAVVGAAVSVVCVSSGIVVMFRVVIIISGICLGIAKGVVGVRRWGGGDVHAFLASRVRPASHFSELELEFVVADVDEEGGTARESGREGIA